MGYFITLEGGDFTGKSLLARNLGIVLTCAGIPHITTREPGGTERGRQLRTKIFKLVEDGVTSTPDIMRLFFEDRRIHLDEVLLPFWERCPEGVVICDRYADSTLVYQVLEGTISESDFFSMHNEYADGLWPNLTFLLCFPNERLSETITTRARSGDQGMRDSTAWDRSDLQVHQLRQDHFLSLADIFRRRGISRQFVMLDASVPPMGVLAQSVIEIECALSKEGISTVGLIDALRQFGETEGKLLIGSKEKR